MLFRIKKTVDTWTAVTVFKSKQSKKANCKAIHKSQHGCTVVCSYS